ncbi:MAG: YeaC family protein [Alcanivorax sp.]|nr:YeaC family protein [Alcanivorax sp.]
MAPQSFEELIDGMTMEVWHNMRRAVETGRWPDGRTLTAEQRELSLQAVIAWELRNDVPEAERTGYVAPAGCSSHAGEEQPVTLRTAPDATTTTDTAKNNETPGREGGDHA